MASTPGVGGRRRPTRAMLQEENLRLRMQLESAGVTAPPDFANGAVIGTPASSGDVDLLRAFQELGAGAARIMLWRVRPDGRQEYARAFDVQEWNLETIRAEYGGGTYVAKFLGSDGLEHGQRQFLIAETRIATADQLSIDLQKLWKEQHPESTGNGKLPAAPADPFAIAAQFANASATQLDAVMRVLSPILERGKDSGMEKLLLELLLKRTDGSSSIESTLTVLEKARELLGSGGGDYSDVLRSVGVPLVQMLTRGVPSNGNVGKRLPPAHANNGVIAVPEQLEAAPPVQIAARTPFVALAEYMPNLLELARAGEDVTLWAPAIDQQHGEEIDVILAIVRRTGAEKAADALVKTFPAALPFRGWFLELISELEAIAVEQADGEDGEE